MIVYLLRHGIAEDVAPGGDDAARRLTARGRERVHQVARGLRRLGVAPAVLLTSPYPRAAETAAIVAATLPGPPPARELPALTPDVPAAQTLHALRPFARHRELMLVGHQPNLGDLAALVLTASSTGLVVDVRKGGCLAIELPGFVPGGGATLRWVLPPRVLRRLS